MRLKDTSIIRERWRLKKVHLLIVNASQYKAKRARSKLNVPEDVPTKRSVTSKHKSRINNYKAQEKVTKIPLKMSLRKPRCRSYINKLEKTNWMMNTMTKIRKALAMEIKKILGGEPTI